MNFKALDRGELVAVVGELLILAGAVWRSRQSVGRRQPPGVL
jgi:hypothetical protein